MGKEEIPREGKEEVVYAQTKTMGLTWFVAVYRADEHGVLSSLSRKRGRKAEGGGKSPGGVATTGGPGEVASKAGVPRVLVGEGVWVKRQ